MLNYVKTFNNKSEYDSYTGSSAYITPNISVYNGTSGKVVKYQKRTPAYLQLVDLGLPSGTLWAKGDVGAVNETDFGTYFCWGETVGYTGLTPSKHFSWADYQFGNGSLGESALTKYNRTDGKTVLDLEDDAAYVHTDGFLRMGTYEEFDELFNNCTVIWTTFGTINGLKYTSNINGNYIFFPAAGQGVDGRVNRQNTTTLLWTSTLYTEDVSQCYRLIGGDSTAANASLAPNYRYFGRVVRGVLRPG